MDGLNQQWSFIATLLRYYKEFLETDFRSRYKPKRRIVLSQNEGLSGINLAKYPLLNELVLTYLTKKFQIPKLDDIDEGEFAIYPSEEAVEKIDELRNKHGKLNEEQLIEEILDNFEEYLNKSKYLEEDNILYSRTELRLLLKSVPPQKYALAIRKYRLFDFYRDITVLLQTKKLTDKTDVYFYFYDIKFDGDVYPVFYIPVSIDHPSFTDGAKPHYSLNFEGSPIIYVNEKALQYISEKISESQKYKVKIDLPKRQFYWNETEDFVEEINNILTKISNRFELPHFNLEDNNVKNENDKVRITSNCYLTVFDKSDEAIINDYEQLLLLLEQGDAKALEIFKTLIQEFLLKNPKVVNLEVDEEFDELSPSEKLTYRSPISLNSEQIKILEALKKDDVRSVIVEGPPGTGKSHTITAIIYDALLNNKSVLVASDKKEALDVVEEKISEVLEKINVNNDGFVQNPILRLGQAENNFNKIFQTQNFEKIKTRFGAYKFNHDKTQDQITERIHKMQDDINTEVEYNQQLYNGVLEIAQQVIEFENKKLKDWTSLVDIPELKQNQNHERLESLRKAIQVLSGKGINLKIAPATWLESHIDDSSKQSVQVVLENLGNISSLIAEVKDKSKLIPLINIISKEPNNWGVFLESGSKLNEISKYFEESEKEIFIKSINQVIALENTSVLKQNLEDILQTLTKIHLLYEKHKSRFGNTILNDLDEKNKPFLREYLDEINKLKSFLWTFTKKDQIEGLNRKLELAFPGANLEKPHGLIPQLESEQLIYEEVVKLRKALGKESKILCSLFDDKNLRLSSETAFENIKNKLEVAINMFDKLEELMEESKILDLCKQISTDKKILTTSEKIREVEQAIELMKHVNNIDNAVASLELEESLKNFPKLDIGNFIDKENLNKLTQKFEELQLAIAYLSDKSYILGWLPPIKESIPLTLKKLKINLDDLGGLKENQFAELSDDLFSELLTYLKNSAAVNDYYEKEELSHYNTDRNLLQNRYIANMTYILDKKVVEFRTDNAADAQQIKQIIRSKAQIPRKYLRILIEAFPCLIVNIRELGEYLPLEPELFDVVIIDEASQVSIAQAFPALLRAKKIVVLGDTKQFSNVKTATASIPINNEVFSLVKDTYKKDIKELDEETSDAIKNKIYRFNIKVSILEFMQSLANYQTMLLKHFRCYKEVVEYSNHNFYGNRLQVMKLRGKNIQDVIRFGKVEDCQEPVQESGATAKIIDNANGNEAQFILDELEKLAEKGCVDSVGVITPFRNQQKYIYEILRASSKYGYFEEKMKLKVMTFDTCQGEERDIVYYSMVESPSNKTRLSTIFAKQISGDDEEGKLREQRLNVGFSRAKESVVFVISKDPEEFKGEIGEAIRTFKTELEEGKKLPKPSELESEGEKLLLNLVQQTNFYRENKEWVNIQAQFPIGEYLRRINNADIPNYRTDFLLTYNPPDSKPVSMILEYDGFEFHFKDGYDVNKLNYDDYYVAQDIERQKALESYGYEFIRLNKFVLKDDPIAILDERFDLIVKKKPIRTPSLTN